MMEMMIPKASPAFAPPLNPLEDGIGVAVVNVFTDEVAVLVPVLVKGLARVALCDIVGVVAPENTSVAVMLK
jgi:hypothetical protein